MLGPELATILNSSTTANLPVPITARTVLDLRPTDEAFRVLNQPEPAAGRLTLDQFFLTNPVAEEWEELPLDHLLALPAQGDSAADADSSEQRDNFFAEEGN